ncbi:MAG: hypothetical protein AB1899_12290 [Pseudomonadota bacterium]
MTTYSRDDQLAVQPESSFGAKIEKSGAYVGRFTLAKERAARTGTRGIEFTFESEDGQTARYLTLWVARANGDKIEYAHGLLSALMVCLDVKTISSAPVTVDEWNAELGAWAPAQVEAFDALMNKPVGVLLQREERVWEGRTHVGMKMVDFFDPRDRSTPSEILAGTRSGQGLARLVDNLREKVVRLDVPPGGAAPEAAKGAGFYGVDEDDVPF